AMLQSELVIGLHRRDQVLRHLWRGGPLSQQVLGAQAFNGFGKHRGATLVDQPISEEPKRGIAEKTRGPIGPTAFQSDNQLVCLQRDPSKTVGVTPHRTNDLTTLRQTWLDASFIKERQRLHPAAKLVRQPRDSFAAFRLERYDQTTSDIRMRGET